MSGLDDQCTPSVPFPEPAAVDEAPQGWSESIAAYLGRSTSPIAIESRAWLTQRLAFAPESSHVDLVQRLRASDDRQHLSACWEIGLAAFLVEHGFQLEPHPTISGTTRRPDWLVTATNAARFYLEATTAACSDAEFAAERRRGQLYDALNKVSSPNHFLNVRVDAEGTATPAGRRLKAQTARALGGWNPDELDDLDLDAMPETTVVDAGWAASLRPIPKDPRVRGQHSGRAIGLIGPIPLVDPTPLIREALEGKAEAYGDLDAPFLIAVNVLAPMADDWAVSSALLGSPALAYATDGSGRSCNRGRDGFWWKGRPTNTRVAAVVLGRQFAQSTTDASAISSWPNPYVSTELDLASLPFQHLVVDTDGRTLRRR
jgi:hypothetical protein